MVRITGVDVIRTVAILGVIVIHTHPFEQAGMPFGTTLDAATLLVQLARFGVPFFFVISGYFWAGKFTSPAQVVAPSLHIARRLTSLFVIWSLVYLLPFDIVDAFDAGPAGPFKLIYWTLVDVASKPLTALLQGTRGHLWFLMSAVCALLIAATLIRYGRLRLLIALAVALYAIGLAGKGYSDSPLGFRTPFNFRDGPFFSLIFFTTGYLLQRQGRQAWWPRAGLTLALLGAILQCVEEALLYQHWGTAMGGDFVIGTYPLGVGMAMIALSNPAALHWQRLAAAGPLVLGIYSLHMAFIELLRPVDRALEGNLLWDGGFVLLVFALSYGAALLLARHHRTRALVC
ncbi:MAG: acyltransferase [Rhodocyclaceae bacterium]